MNTLDKNKPVAKYRLHAKRVSKIALVDRGAVPDALMIAYKRRDDNPETRNWDVEGIVNLIKEKKFSEIPKAIEEITKGYYGADSDFNTAFIYKGIYAAVDALNGEIWDAIYSDIEGKNKASLIDKAISDFENLMTGTFLKLGKKNKKETTTKLTVEEVTNSVERSLSLSALDGAFYTLSSMMTFIIMEQAEFEDAKATIIGIAETFKGFIQKNLESVINKSLKELENEELVFEKAGAKISAARLKKLKESAILINEIISEAGEAVDEEVNKNIKFESEENMENEELVKGLKAVTESVKGIVDVMKSQGCLLNAEEQIEFDKKKQEVLDKQEADAKVEQDAKDVKDAEAKVTDDAKVAEDAKVAGEAVEAEKAFKETVNKGLEDVKTALEGFDALKKNLSKKFGEATFLNTEVIENKGATNVDVFAEGLK